jgi:hypothetical protein
MNILLAPIAGVLPPLLCPPLPLPDGSYLNPTSALLTVHIGSDLFPLSGLPIINPASHEVTYTWSPAETITLLTTTPRLNNRAQWVLSDGFKTLQLIQWFDILAIPLATTVVEDDLLAVSPYLNEQRFNTKGMVTTGTSTTIFIDSQRQDAPRRWDGSVISFETGLNKGLKRRITLYDAITSTFTLSLPLSFTPVPGDLYTIAGSFKPQIDLAFIELVTRLQKQYSPETLSRTIDGADLRLPHLYLSLEKVVFQKWGATEDYRQYNSLFTAALNDMILKIQARPNPIDGNFKDDDKRLSGQQIWAR